MTVILAAFVVLIARLVYLQVIEGAELRRQSELNSIRVRIVDAPRGLIYDRHNRLLVDNRPAYDLGIVPGAAAPLDATLARLSHHSGLSGEQWQRSLEKIKNPKSSRPVWIKPDIDRDTLAAIEVNRWDLPGVVVQVSSRRDYLFGAGAAHLLGYVGEISEDELKSAASRRYRGGDYIGKYGIERAMEPWLRGKRGGQQVEVNAIGQVVRVLNTVETIPGYNLILSIDHALQANAERLLENRSGAVVAVEPDTGQILAMASSPTFDPNTFISGMSHETWQALISDSRFPLSNKAIQAEYPPASTYKIIAAAAGLEEGLITDRTTFFCPGFIQFGDRSYRCWKRWGHGEVDIYKALAESCDVYFYKLGQELGVDRLAWYARAFGMGEPTGIDLDHEAAGLVPTAAWKKRKTGVAWQKGETLSVVIGQGFNLATPLQIAMMTAAVGNGGTRYLPRTVSAVRAADGRVLHKSVPEIRGRLPVSNRNLEVIREGLFRTVNHKTGTAYKSRLDETVMSGKTGTAQVVGRKDDDSGARREPVIKDHAWFLAYAPRNHPKIAVAVILEHGEHGSSAAAPVAAELIRFYLSETALAETTSAETAPTGTTPAGADAAVTSAARRE